MAQNEAFLLFFDKGGGRVHPIIRALLVSKDLRWRDTILLSLLGLEELSAFLADMAVATAIATIVGGNPSGSYGWVLMALLLRLADFTVGWGRHLWYIRTENERRRVLVAHATDAMMRISAGDHRSGTPEKMKLVLAQGTEAVKNTIYYALLTLLPCLATTLFACVGILTLSLPLGIFLTGSMGWTLHRAHLVNVFMRPALRENEKRNNKAEARCSELRNNLPTVIVAGKQETASQMIDDEYAARRDRNVAVHTEYAYRSMPPSFFVIFINSGVLFLGGILVGYGKLTPTGFSIAVMWTNRIVGHVHSLKQVSRELIAATATLDTYFELLDESPSRVDLPTANDKDHLEREIRFQGVEFVYPVKKHDKEEGDEAPEQSRGAALLGLDLVIPKGKHVALVGASGAGKSTIMHLLLRAYDTVDRGEILVDGRDIRLITKASWRRLIGFVEQRTVLFNWSIKENISFGAPIPLSDEAAWKLLEMVVLADWVRSLPKGIDTPIGTNGTKVSGGQGQRLGIARALAKSPEILLFDEATSALDTESELAVQTSIRKASVGRTTITIAHRLATVIDADIIYVIDHGRVAANGTHQELLSSSHDYQRLIGRQMIGGDLPAIH